MDRHARTGVSGSARYRTACPRVGHRHGPAGVRSHQGHTDNHGLPWVDDAARRLSSPGSVEKGGGLAYSGKAILGGQDADVTLTVDHRPGEPDLNSAQITRPAEPAAGRPALASSNNFSFSCANQGPFDLHR